jgi:soluble lytic murein transglycosylase-like protein
MAGTGTGIATKLKSTAKKAAAAVSTAGEMAKERLFAYPYRPNSYAAGGLNQTATPYDTAQLADQVKAQVKASPTKTSLSNSVPSYVPSQYRSWVASAAAGTGLPASIVAAQINDESGFDANAVSPAGAQGIAQFIPSTWASNAPKGSSPFDPTAANAAYIKLMGTLLTQEGGNIRNALAAYNAGPNNLSAGYGYADSILAAAGAPRTASAGSSSSYGGTRPGGQPASPDGTPQDTGQGVDTLFANYESEVATPRTAPKSTFTSPATAGLSAPFQWWWQSWSGTYAQEESESSGGSS